MTRELKPCPFCGSIPEIEQRLWGWMIYCTKCECVLKNCAVCPPTRQETIIKWNSRAEPRELPEWFIHRLKNVIYGYSSCNGGYRDGYVKAIEWILSLKKEE